MARPKMKRPVGRRRESTNVLIVCDGETEENYLKYVLKPYLSAQNIAVKLDLRKFKDIKATNNYIKRKPGDPPFDAVIFIRDLENSNLTPAECSNLEKFENASGKQANKSYWFVFYNYPSIEFWYILHFSQCRKRFNNADEAFRELKKNHFTDYEKPMPRNNRESELFLKNIGKAINHSKKLKIQTVLGYSQRITKTRNLTNPMTDMHHLVKLLTTPRENFRKMYEMLDQSKKV